MFHEQHISQQENMLMLSLYNCQLIERAPSLMGEAVYPYAVKYSKMQVRQALHLEVKVLPQIQLRLVTQLSDSIRKGKHGQNLNQMAALFRLGLGVPRLATVAQYLEGYSVEADEDSSALVVICDLVDSHVAKLEEAYGPHSYVPYARYLDHMYNFKQMIDVDVKGTLVRRKMVPEGMPVVLLYKLKSMESNTFVLSGGFRFTDKGFPINFDHIVCRTHFKAAPKYMKSKSLQGHCNYVLVTGILAVQSRSYDQSHLIELGHHTEEVLLNDPSIVRKAGLHKEGQELKDLNREMASARQLKDKYEGGVVPKSKRGAHQKAVELLESPEAIRYFRNVERLEQKIVKKLQHTGPIPSCKFYALDLGLIKNCVDFQHVKTKLTKVEAYLKQVGFELASEADGTRKVQVHTTQQKTRIWNI